MTLRVLAVLLPCLATVVQAQVTPDLAARTDQIVAAVRAGDEDALMRIWSAQSPYRLLDRKHVARGLDHRSADGTDVSLAGVRPSQQSDVVSLQAADLSYEVELRREGAEWRIWHLRSTEEDRATQILKASATQRMRMIADRPATRGLTLELLHRAIDQLESGSLDSAASTFDLAGEIGDDSAKRIAMRGIGDVDYARGNVDAAIAQYQKVLKDSEASHDRRNEAKTLNRIANIERVRGDYPTGEAHFTTALEIFRELGDKSGQANMLHNLANMRSLVGDSAAARRDFGESLKLYRSLNDSDGISIVLNDLGIEDRLAGDYSGALSNFRQALDLSRAAGDEEGVAYALGNMGNVLLAQGNYMEALEAYQQSISGNERLGNHDAVSAALSGIGELYASLGEYEQAMDYHQRVRKSAQRSGYKEGLAIAAHNIAEAYSHLGQPRRALEEYKRALAIDTDLKDPHGIAIDLTDIGSTYLAQNNRIEARRSFQKSLETARKADAKESVVIAELNLADLDERAKSHDAALEHARTALAMANEVGLPDSIIEAHTLLGRIHRRRGELTAARADFKRAVDGVEELRREAPGEEAAERAFERRIAPYQEMIELLVAQSDNAAALEFAERAKGRVLLDVMRGGRAETSRAMTAEEREREDNLTAKISELNRSLQKGPEDASLKEQLAEARLAYEDFQTHLYAEHPRLRIQRGETVPISAGGVAAILKSARIDALLEYVVTDDVTFLFVIRPGQDVHVHRVPITRARLQHEVANFRQRLADRDLGYGPSARALFHRLVGPADAEIRSARLLCIVPDGPLWELPFQALQLGTGRFLIDRQAIFLAPSATVLEETLRLKPRREGPATLLAVGNPETSSAVTKRLKEIYRDAALGPLPQSEREVRQIAAIYGVENSRVYVGADAREDTVKAEAARFRVIHFATHGVLDDANPLYSRLILASSGSRSDDGLLEAREIMQLNLDADLVVLSACDTGRGRAGAGEGLIGLTWALFVAGCPTTVASQWKVSSQSTADLMIDFHRRLRSNADISPAVALRDAALQVRRNPEYRHPFYWAAFVLIGDGH